VVGRGAATGAARPAAAPLADAGGLVDGHLLVDGQVHAQVQEGVGAAFFHRVDGGQRGGLVGQVGLVFGVLADPRAATACMGSSGSAGLQAGLGGAEEAPDVVLGGLEHPRIVTRPPNRPTGCRMNITTERLFTEARTQNGYLPTPLPTTRCALYDLLKWGPTAANSCPARFVFVRSAEARERLLAVHGPRQRGQGAAGAGDRDHRHGHGVPRPAAAALSAHRRTRLVRRQARH
jgi:hypothetical protein